MKLPERFAGENYRGRRLPRVLGAGIAIGTSMTLVVRNLAGSGLTAEEVIAAAGAGLVFLAGLVDDLFPIGPRGLRNHLRELVAGHMTTGILKLIVTGGAAIVVVATKGFGSWGIASAAAVLLMGTTNLWNGLDVRPGRALKFFLATMLLLVAIEPPGGPDVAVVRSMWPWALLALVPDLRERAMLGDSGSNLLGFTIGLALVDVVAPPALVALALATLMLNVIADTFTLSRSIGAVAPLRWFDLLGRRPDEPPGPSASEPSSASDP